MLDDFLKYLEAEKQYSKLTVLAYGDDIRQFLLYYGVDEKDFRPEKVTHLDIRGWIMSMVSEGAKSTTVNRKVSSLRSYYRYLMRRGIVSRDPLAKITSLKKPRRVPVFVEKSKVVRFSDFLMEPSADYETERRLLIIILFYATGIRLAELIGIDVEDISLEQREIKVTGKGNKQRIVPIPQIVALRLKNYLDLRKNICNSDKNPLFLSNKLERISRTEVYKIVNEVLALMGVEGKKSPHVLRHTFATHLLNEGAGIETVKELLGHSNLSTTQIYTHSTIAELKKSYDNAHPRAKNKNEKD